MQYASLNGKIDLPGTPGADGMRLLTELLNFCLTAVYAVPMRKRFQFLDLAPVSALIINTVFVKICPALADSHFCDKARYWRLSSLCLKFMRVILKGPMYPLSSS